MVDLDRARAVERGRASGPLSPDADRIGGGTPGLDTLARYLVATWHGTQQQAAAGNADLPGQMHAGWQMVLSAICREPEPRRSLLALNDELDLAMRTDPETIIPPVLPAGDDCPGPGGLAGRLASWR